MKNKLTVQNFLAELTKALCTRFVPINADARAQEASNTLRSLIGDNAWEHGLLSERDIVTLYAVIEARKLGIPASEDREGHENQHWLARLVKETGPKFGMREGDFENPRMINKAAMNMLLSAEPASPMRGTDYDAFANRYGGSDKKGSLIDPDLLPDENPLIIKKRAKPEPKQRPEKKISILASEPAHKIFDRRWEALQNYAAAIEDMDADGITSFIASGPKEAINLDAGVFKEKCDTARKSLGWNQIDSPEAQKLINNLETAYSNHHKNRELGGKRRD